jgi:hypothetical protein
VDAALPYVGQGAMQMPLAPPPQHDVPAVRMQNTPAMPGKLWTQSALVAHRPHDPVPPTTPLKAHRVSPSVLT